MNDLRRLEIHADADGVAYYVARSRTESRTLTPQQAKLVVVLNNLCMGTIMGGVMAIFLGIGGAMLNPQHYVNNSRSTAKLPDS
ncbi:MAG: hypothetical protein K2Q20_10460 [Phycisphaerales bacterium]|nr:hypothetical protein [Phycisphaerales bacterium]